MLYVQLVGILIAAAAAVAAGVAAISARRSARAAEASALAAQRSALAAEKTAALGERAEEGRWVDKMADKLAHEQVPELKALTDNMPEHLRPRLTDLLLAAVAQAGRRPQMLHHQGFEKYYPEVLAKLKG